MFSEDMKGIMDAVESQNMSIVKPAYISDIPVVLSSPNGSAA